MTDNKKTILCDEMTDATFNDMMQKGIAEAKADQSRPFEDVFEGLRQELSDHYVLTREEYQLAKSD